MKTLILRHETKPFEHRSPLTPLQAENLIKSKIKVCVESSPYRAYADEEYEDVGCEIISTGDWVNADKNCIILGLKELEDKDFSLIHQHIYFAHSFKQQEGSEKTLLRFKQGGGTLYDLEYLLDENNNRIAAFGYWAGFVGAGISIMLLKNSRKELKAYFNKQNFIDDVKAHIDSPLSAIVFGSKGRCGTGACDLLKSVGITHLSWDLAETKNGGPFKEITNHDIFINCVLMNKKIPPFIDKSILNKDQNLKIIADISCDPNGPYNPIPLYHSVTTIDNPLLTTDTNPEIKIMAIDHLPSLLPRESSEYYAKQLFPYLKDFLLDKNLEVWDRAKSIFNEHLN